MGYLGRHWQELCSQSYVNVGTSTPTMVVGMLKDGKASDRGGVCGGVVKGSWGVGVTRDSGSPRQ